MAILNTFRNVLLESFFPKFQPSSIHRSADTKEKPINKYKNSEPKSEPKSEPQQIVFDTPEEMRKRQLQKCKILLRKPEYYHLISGVPLEITNSRMARLYQPRKNAMQSGTSNIRHWELDFETKERWENPLMGWSGSGDSLSNVKMCFATKEEAIDYCNKNRMKYWIQESKLHKKFKVRSYAINFHHKNKTRVSTK